MRVLSRLFARDSKPNFRHLQATRDVDALFAATMDADWYTRYQATQALMEIGDERAVPILLARLDDEHKEVRNAAARALNRIGGARAVQVLTERGLRIQPARGASHATPHAAVSRAPQSDVRTHPVPAGEQRKEPSA